MKLVFIYMARLILSFFLALNTLALNTLSLNSARAENPQPDLQEQQRRLKALLNEIEASEKEQSQQSEQLKQLEQQLGCKWALIQSYETCNEKYPTNLQLRLDCTTKAREEEQRCLSGIE